MSMTFFLSGGVVPKARPRVTKHGTFMPHRYRDWKDSAIASLIDQAGVLLLSIPLTTATVQINLVGKHPRRGDLDNIAGSVLDALVQAGILKDDSLAVVSSLAIAPHWSKESPTVKIQLNQGV